MVEIVRPCDRHEEWDIESCWRAKTVRCDALFGVQSDSMVARDGRVEMRQLWESVGRHKSGDRIELDQYLAPFFA